MADKTGFLRASALNRDLPVGTFNDSISIALTAGYAAQNDRVQLATITRDMRLFDAYMSVSGTLGASCTAKLQRDRAGVYTDITVATTAGGASVVNGTTIGPMDLLAGDILTVLIAGAAQGTAATLAVDLQLQGK